MSIIDYVRLEEVSNETSIENKFELAISPDHSKICIVTNLPYQGKVTLKLKSIN